MSGDVGVDGGRPGAGDDGAEQVAGHDATGPGREEDGRETAERVNGRDTADAAPASRWGNLSELASRARFGRFVSVGVLGAVCDNAVLAALRLGAGVPELWAKAAGIETAIVVMFLANERWTFSEAGREGGRALLRRLGTSHVVRAGGVTVQLVVFWLLTARAGVELVVAGADVWFLVASPAAIGVATLVNYAAESLFTWRVTAQ